MQAIGMVTFTGNVRCLGRNIDMQSARAISRWFTAFLLVCLSFISVTAASAASPTASLALTGSSPSVLFGQSVTLTATLAITGTVSDSQGAYSIYDGSTAIISGALPNLPNGLTEAISSLSVGRYTLTAQYVGQDNGLTATSGEVIVQVNANVASLSLPPSNQTFPSGTIGELYSAAINVSGGDQRNYQWTVNSTQVPTAGTHIKLSNGIEFWNTGGYTLSIGGTPTAAGTVNFSVSVDDTGTGQTASQTYSITVDAAQTHYVNGGVNLANCGASVAGVKVTINTNPPKFATTNSSGAYTISGVPNGSYTVTPSISGASSVFYPASRSFTVNGGDVDENFSAAIGYTVTGTVHYSGTKTGRIYIELYSNNCGGSPLGTSIASKGPFTIRGVPPGSYTLNAWMDTEKNGVANAGDPSSLVSGNPGVTVPANDANASVTLNDPPAVTLSSPPGLQGAAPFNDGAVVFFKAITNNNNIELPASYTLEWSASSKFTSVIGSQNFPAIGPNGTNIWIVNGTGLASGTGLANGKEYYFRARGVAGSAASGWSSPIGPVTIGAPTTGNRITGYVTFSGTARGPLYVGFYNQSAGGAYVTEVGSKSSPPTTGANFTVYVPSGSGYFMFGIIDQNNDGVVDAGDIQNTGGDSSSTVSITKPQGMNLTLPSASSTATVTTDHSRQVDGGTTNDNYSLEYRLYEGVKLPVAMALTKGPNVLVPMDIGLCTNCGSEPFNFWSSTGSVAPTVGSTYDLQVTYSDGTSETKSANVSAVLNAFATLDSPTGTGVSARPNFSWSDPANASSYLYKFSLQGENSNGDLWDVPGNNSNYYGMPSSIHSLIWNEDPLSNDNNNSLPDVSSLSNGSYYWQISATDNNSNTATMQANFTVGSGNSGVSLPSPNPSSLGQATVGEIYNGAINAAGAPSDGNYTWTVNGVTLQPHMPYSYVSVANGDGLTVATSGGNTLWFAGTPSSATTVHLNVSVSHPSYGSTSQTYNLVVGNASPLSLPGNGSATALTGYAFAQTVDVSGGKPPYTWTVNSSTVTAGGSGKSLGDGLFASLNSGGNALTVSGNPATAPDTVEIDVSVTDSAKTTVPASYEVDVVAGPDGSHISYLSGRYVCLTQGYSDNDGAKWASLSSFSIAATETNGKGTFTGEFDVNGADFGSGAKSGAISGSYSVGADNNGLATITSIPTSGSGNTTNWAIALTDAVTPAQEFRMAEVDDMGPSASGQHGSANCYLATPLKDIPAGIIDGNRFAFGIGGESSGANPKSAAGRFSTSRNSTTGATTITNGIVDIAKGGCSTNEEDSFSGTYTEPDANARFTITLDPTQLTPATCPSEYSSSATRRAGLRLKPESSGGGSSTPTLAIYIIDANRAFMLETDTEDGMMAGNVRTQQQATYSTTSASGPFVLYQQGVEYNSNDSPSGGYSKVIQGKATGSASAAYYVTNACYGDDSGTYESNCAKPTTQVPLTFDATYPGRAALQPGKSGKGYLYAFGTTTAGNQFSGFNAFELSVDGSGGFDSGWVEAQTQTTFTPAAVAGNYMLAKMPPGENANDAVGEITMSSSGGDITGSVTTAGEGDFSYDQSMSMTYAFDTTYPDTGSLLIGSGNKGLSCIVISPVKVVCTGNGDNSPDLMMLQQ